jgi:hypothetical protein
MVHLQSQATQELESYVQAHNSDSQQEFKIFDVHHDAVKSTTTSPGVLSSSLNSFKS